MLFTTLNHDCVLEILKKISPQEIRKVKMVNERMMSIVEGFEVDKMIYEVGFTKHYIYVKYEKESKPICTANYECLKDGQEEWSRVCFLVKQASLIVNLRIMNWQVEEADTFKLKLYFGLLGIRSESRIENLRFENSRFELLDSFSEFVDLWSHEKLHLKNIKYNEDLLDYEFFNLKNLRSMNFAKPLRGQSSCYLGPDSLSRMRHSPLDILDLKFFKSLVYIFDVLGLIKFALGKNLKVYWDFGELMDIFNPDRENIQHLKEIHKNISIKMRETGRDVLQQFYTIGTENATFKLRTFANEEARRKYFLALRNRVANQ